MAAEYHIFEFDSCGFIPGGNRKQCLYGISSIGGIGIFISGNLDDWWKKSKSGIVSEISYFIGLCEAEKDIMNGCPFFKADGRFPLFKRTLRFVEWFPRKKS